MEPGCSVVYGGRTSDKRHKLKQEIQTAYKEKLFHCNDSYAVEQVAQRGCAASSLEFTRLNWIKPSAAWSDLIAHPALSRRTH